MVYSDLRGGLAQLFQIFFCELSGMWQVTELPKNIVILEIDPRFSLTQINVRRPGRR